MTPGGDRPDYPTWVRSRRILVFWAVVGGILGLSLVVALRWLPGLALVLLAIPFLYIAVVITWTSYRLGPRGGDYQSRIHQLVVDSVGGGGRLLDVGCGSGQLLIRAARSAPGEYVGLDSWGPSWEYSVEQARRNARLEGVQRLRLVRGSASRLPFAEARFRRVVSCLTFHEVRDTADRTDTVVEALRVLEPGGRFAFLDLFDGPEFPGGRAGVLRAVAEHGGEVHAARRLSEVLDLPFPLTLGKVLGHAVLVSGVKAGAAAFGSQWWEQHYQEHGTGRHVPSPHLVAEVGGLPVGAALDAGCGPGADAVWLAEQGWQVTAVDVSPTVLRRAEEYAAAQAPAAAARIRWLVADLTEWKPPQRYDLVVSQYVHPAVPFGDFVARLAEAVAPGGTLFLAGHDRADTHSAAHAPQEAALGPESVVSALSPGAWEVDVAETRTRRAGHGGEETMHDVVVRAHRTASD